MQATAVRKGGGRIAPRHYAARDLIAQLLDAVSQAGGAYTCWGWGRADPEATAYLIEKHLGEATWLASNGLREIVSQCGRGDDDRRADSVISNLDSLKLVMLRDIREGLPAQEYLSRQAGRVFRGILLPVSIDLSAEEILPSWNLDPAGGLVVNESGACRVILHDMVPGKNSPVVAFVDGRRVEIEGRYKRAFRRALVKMIAACNSGRKGISLEELGTDQGALSSVRKCDPIWKGVISTPGERDDGTGWYFIQHA